MAETTEKIYCTGDNDALLASLIGKNNDPTLALMSNQWMNNPFIYLVFLMMFGRNGLWGNNDTESQITAMRNQMADNQNSNLLMDAVKGNDNSITALANNLNCDFNSLKDAICTVRSGIQDVAGKVGYSAERVINAANLGDLNIVQQLKDCCCQTQQNIIKMGYENQLGQKDIQNAMQQGFAYTNTGIERAASNIGNLIQSVACDIKTSGKDNTQRIIDTMNNHWQTDLQQRYNDARLELSQVRQNQYLISQLKTTTTTA